tara:strand:+ start:471 stop:803 length:333 start_codon:yes stop_codon:yes gene_type:complete
MDSELLARESPMLSMLKMTWLSLVLPRRDRVSDAIWLLGKDFLYTVLTTILIVSRPSQKAATTVKADCPTFWQQPMLLLIVHLGSEEQRICPSTRPLVSSTFSKVARSTI